MIYIQRYLTSEKKKRTLKHIGLGLILQQQSRSEKPSSTYVLLLLKKLIGEGLDQVEFWYCRCK